jgi:hypothetical protein
VRHGPYKVMEQDGYHPECVKTADWISYGLLSLTGDFKKNLYILFL